MSNHILASVRFKFLRISRAKYPANKHKIAVKILRFQSLRDGSAIVVSDSYQTLLIVTKTSLENLCCRLVFHYFHQWSLRRCEIHDEKANRVEVGFGVEVRVVVCSFCFVLVEYRTTAGFGFSCMIVRLSVVNILYR